MSRTTSRFTAQVVVGIALFGITVALSPDVAAAPLKTGGYACIDQSAGAVGADGPGGCAGAPVADMAGVPMALPGPLPLGAAAVPIPVGIPPVPVGVPPVPVGVPPVPFGVPPVPVGVPPVPLGAGALAVPLPVGAPVVGAVPVGAPILDMAGVAGKGVPTGPPVAGDPVSGQPIPAGPAAAG